MGASGGPLLAYMLKAMWGLSAKNRARQKKFKASKGLLMDILSRQYDDTIIHKLAVTLACVLAFCSEDVDFFLPLVLAIRSYYRSMPREDVPDRRITHDIPAWCETVLNKYRFPLLLRDNITCVTVLYNRKSLLADHITVYV